MDKTALYPTGYSSLLTCLQNFKKLPNYWVKSTMTKIQIDNTIFRQRKLQSTPWASNGWISKTFHDSQKEKTFLKYILEQSQKEN
jgi:hypothetical protein